MEREAEELAGKTVEDAAGASELLEALFLFAEFTGVRNERAAGAASGVLDVKHFVEENVLDGEARDLGTVHAAIEEDLVGSGIVTTQLAAPRAGAPADFRAMKRTSKVARIQIVEHLPQIKVAALRAGVGKADAGMTHAMNAAAGARGASVVKIRVDQNSGSAAAINAGEEESCGAFEHSERRALEQIGEADVNGVFAAANGEDETGIRIELDTETRRAALTAETRIDTLEESGTAGDKGMDATHSSKIDFIARRQGATNSRCVSDNQRRAAWGQRDKPGAGSC